MDRGYKEPIQFKWIWLVLAVIVLAGIPWYLPKGTIYPIILGFPYWALISVLSAVILAVFLTYVINNYWDMEKLADDSEEGGSDK